MTILILLFQMMMKLAPVLASFISVVMKAHPKAVLKANRSASQMNNAGAESDDLLDHAYRSKWNGQGRNNGESSTNKIAFPPNAAGMDSGALGAGRLRNTDGFKRD